MEKRITIGKIWGVIYPVLLYFLIQVVVVNVGSVVIMLYLSMIGRHDVLSATTEIFNNNILLINIIAEVIAAPILILLYHLDCKKEKNSADYVWYEKIRFPKYLLIVPFGIFSMLSANYFVSLLSVYMPAFMTESFKKTSEALYSPSIILQILGAVVFAPVVEELVFRGLVYARLKKISNITIAAVISALLFGIYHANWVQAPYAFIIGILCVFVYEKYKSIIAPIIFHASANMFSVLMANLFSSGSDSVGEQTKGLSGVWMIIALLILIWFTGAIAAVLGYAIHKTVRAKEIKPEMEQQVTNGENHFENEPKEQINPEMIQGDMNPVELQSNMNPEQNQMNINPEVIQSDKNPEEILEEKDTEESRDETTDNHNTVL